MTFQSTEITLHLPLQPKRAPVFNSRSKVAYKEHKYQAWLTEAKPLLKRFWPEPALQKDNLVGLQMIFRGPSYCDLDNLAGAVMDAGKGIIWADDRVTIIRRLEAAWERRPMRQQSIHLKITWQHD